MMKMVRQRSSVLTLLAVGTFLACSTPAAKSPDVSDSIRRSLDQSGFKDVSVSQDRNKEMITLGGQVASDGDKARAESIAELLAPGEVVANQIAVVAPEAPSDATVSSDLDKGIEKNLHAALVQSKLQHVKYDVKNQVVTLKGEVNSQSKREQAERVASSVPNVQQVANELEVKDQNATSSK